MKIFEVAEVKKKAAFALGRLNPATIGHELLVDAIKIIPGDSFLFLTDRAPKLPNDPLTPKEKLDWARKSFDGIAIGLAKTVLTAADRLYKMGYTEVTFLEGEPKLLKLLQDYNGVEKPMHNYNFDKINYKQLTRDPEAAGATAMSGTKLRGYVTNNDLNGFKSGVTQLAQSYADEMFKKLQSAMGVDSVDSPEPEFSDAAKKGMADFKAKQERAKQKKYAKAGLDQYGRSKQNTFGYGSYGAKQFADSIEESSRSRAKQACRRKGGVINSLGQCIMPKVKEEKLNEVLPAALIVPIALVSLAITLYGTVNKIMDSAEKAEALIKDSEAIKTAVANNEETFYSNMFGGKVKIVNGEVVPLERNKEVN